MGHTGRGHDDPYELLGVQAGASRRDISRAYRQAAQQAHPDTQPHDQAAAARFRALTAAYELLTDPVRRADYDRRHRARGTDSRRTPDPGQVRRHGSAQAPGPPWHQPVWAGPVVIEPAGPVVIGPAGPVVSEAPAADQSRRPPPATTWIDPPVVLGVGADGVWGWVW